MMEAAQLGVGIQDRVRRRLVLDRAAIRRILFQGVVDAVLVVVAHVISDQPAKMLLVQCDDMVEDLAAATSDPARRNPILPGCLNARSFGFQTCRVQERDHISVGFRVPVEDYVTVWSSNENGPDPSGATG